MQQGLQCQEIWTTNTDTNTDNTDTYRNIDKHRRKQKHICGSEQLTIGMTIKSNKNDKKSAESITEIEYLLCWHFQKVITWSCATAAVLKIKLNRRNHNHTGKV